MSETVTMAAVTICGMPLEQWTYASCTAEFATDAGWATLYSIRSREHGKGHATTLLTAAKKHYEEQGKVVGGSVALNARMKAIYQRLEIKEYSDDDC